MGILREALLGIYDVLKPKPQIILDDEVKPIDSLAYFLSRRLSHDPVFTGNISEVDMSRTIHEFLLTHRMKIEVEYDLVDHGFILDIYVHQIHGVIDPDPTIQRVVKEYFKDAIHPYLGKQITPELEREITGNLADLTYELMCLGYIRYTKEETNNGN